MIIIHNTNLSCHWSLWHLLELIIFLKRLRVSGPRYLQLWWPILCLHRELNPGSPTWESRTLTTVPSFDNSPASSPNISTQYPPEIWVFINIEYQDDQRATIKYFSLKRHKMKSCIFLLFKIFIVPLKNEHTTLLSLNSYSFKKNYVQKSPWAGVYYTFIGYIIFSFLVLWDKSRCYYHILV